MHQLQLLRMLATANNEDGLAANRYICISKLHKWVSSFLTASAH